jgi:hypothetical protein
MGFNPAIVNVLELVKEAVNIIIGTTNSTLFQYIYGTRKYNNRGTQ